MWSFRKIIVVSLFFIPMAFLNAQEVEDIRFEEIDTILNKVILKKEMMGGGMLHSNGLGILFRKGYNASAFHKNLWELEITGMKSHKEVKITNYYSTYYNAKSYIYGKINKIYIVRAGLGRQILLNTKPYWGGVELRFGLYGGLALSFAKPYYLYILDQENFYTPEPEKYDPEKHFPEIIYGRAPWTYGLDEIKFYPGAYLKGALNFEFGEYNTNIKSLEVGVAVDGYPIPVPIVANVPANYYFLTGYLNFTFGKRYNKY